MKPITVDELLKVVNDAFHYTGNTCKHCPLYPRCEDVSVCGTSIAVVARLVKGGYLTLATDTNVGGTEAEKDCAKVADVKFPFTTDSNEAIENCQNMQKSTVELLKQNRDTMIELSKWFLEQAKKSRELAKVFNEMLKGGEE